MPGLGNIEHALPAETFIVVATDRGVSTVQTERNEVLAMSVTSIPCERPFL
jgi:hypothetical protein